MEGALDELGAVANDPDDPNAPWVTEVWEGRTNHRDSLSPPSVQEANAYPEAGFRP